LSLTRWNPETFPFTAINAALPDKARNYLIRRAETLRWYDCGSGCIRLNLLRIRIRFVTANREFIGAAWVGWLLSQKVPFRIRIKAGEYLLHEDGQEKRAREWFALQGCRCKPQPMELWGCPFMWAAGACGEVST
jgi:hypothetical protein